MKCQGQQYTLLNFSEHRFIYFSAWTIFTDRFSSLLYPGVLASYVIQRPKPTNEAVFAADRKREKWTTPFILNSPSYLLVSSVELIPHHHIKAANPSLRTCSFKKCKHSPSWERVILPDINRAKLADKILPLSNL